MLLTNTLAAGAAGLVAAGLTVATMVPSSTATEPVTDVTPTATQAPALACGAVRDRLPDALAEDLEALRDVEPGERRGALREIRRTALDGGYGERARLVAERRHEERGAHRARLREQLPVELREDLRELRSLPAEERAEAARGLAERARAGEYGPRAQEVAARIEERRAICAAQD